MLNIIIDMNYKQYKPIDMEMKFGDVRGLRNTTEVNNILWEIEKAKYFSESAVIDRFGVRLSI